MTDADLRIRHPRSRSNGEHAGEEIREHSQRHKPHANDHEDVPSPSLEGRSALPDALGHSLLGERDEKGRAEGKHHDCSAGDSVGRKRCAESSAR